MWRWVQHGRQKRAWRLSMSATYIPFFIYICRILLHRGNHGATSVSFGKYGVAVTTNCQEKSFSIQYCWLIITGMLDTLHKWPPKIQHHTGCKFVTWKESLPLSRQRTWLFFPLLFFQKAIFATMRSSTSHVKSSCFYAFLIAHCFLPLACCLVSQVFLSN